MAKEEQVYKTRELERKVAGMQRQLNIMNARQERQQATNERRLRDLEIRDAVRSGVPQKKTAEIFEISAARVSQIMKRIG